MTRTTTPQAFAATFTIPVEQWSATDTIQTETIRARRRAWIRRMARDQWRLMRREGRAWRVERFVAVVGVAYPRLNDVVPSRAAETVKPIIDGGTDARLWPDDDALHRCATIYFQLPDVSAPNTYRLQVFVFPVPDTRPTYQVTGALSQALGGMWERAGARRPSGWSGFVARFQVPHRLWITSNLTDSDLAARQHGARRSERWGGWSSFGTRGRVNRMLGQHVLQQWAGQSYARADRFIVLAGVSYPIGVGKDQADPDNAAETVNTILDSGVQAGAWSGVGAKRCKGVGFFRWPVDCPGGRHEIHLIVLPVPDGGQLLDAVADSYEQAWRAWTEARR